MLAAQLRDIAVVLGQGAREGVAARAVGDEIEIVAGVGMQHGAQRGEPGIVDRRRRQAGMEIGVVRRIHREILVVERMIERLGAAMGQRVDHRGIGLQLHAEPQPVQEDGGNMRPLLLARGLLFDDRGQHQRLGRAGQGQLGAALRPGAGQRPVHGAAHPRQQLLAPVAQHIEIGIGKEAALGRRLLDAALKRILLPQQGDHLEAGKAFGHGQAMLHDTAAGDERRGGARADGRGEVVFAGLQRAKLPVEQGAKDEGPGMGEDALLGEQIRHRAPAGAARDDDGLAAGERPRPGIIAPPPEGSAGRRGGGQQRRAKQAPAPPCKHSGRLREDQRGVGAAEAEGVGQGVADRPLLRLVRHQIDVAACRRIIEIEGRRHDAVAHGQDREDGLDAAGRAQQMADRRFGRGHRQLVGVHRRTAA